MNCGIIIGTAILASEIRTTKPVVLEDTAQRMAMEHLVDSWHPVDSVAVLAPTIKIKLSSVKKQPYIQCVISYSEYFPTVLRLFQ